MRLVNTLKFWSNQNIKPCRKAVSKEVGSTVENLRLVDEDINRQLSEETVTGNSITNRATLLLTTAVIFVGVSNKNPQLGYGEIISSAFGLLASVSAVLTLFSRKSVRDTSIEALVKVADQVGELELRGKILAAKYRTLTERRGAHKNQLFWLRFGYGSLLLAVLAAMLPVLLGRF
ncbi:hypothetical protein [Corynebacterium tuberculostearicum]|uniref:hypothetical protein n=1 Tax=Corynebacterium tuberculostearicum TaxID=38304 RepID=UPI002549F9D9|nr:hypothetical protein [Corynebacterium tuberculostearicum]MDK8676734.1 hypothetical protein [Corynebacterium tuberculostearicum]